MKDKKEKIKQIVKFIDTNLKDINGYESYPEKCGGYKNTLETVKKKLLEL